MRQRGEEGEHCEAPEGEGEGEGLRVIRGQVRVRLPPSATSPAGHFRHRLSPVVTEPV